MNTNICDELKKVGLFITAVVKEAQCKNYYGNVWSKIKNANYGLEHYNDSYVRKCFYSKYGYSIYEYYQSKLYESILLKLATGTVPIPENKKSELLGIKQCIIKIEDYYHDNISDLLDKIKSYHSTFANNEIRLEEFLDNIKWIDEFNVDKITGDVSMIINPKQFFLALMTIYTPIRLSRIFKDIIDQEESDVTKRFQLLSFEKFALELPPDNEIHLSDEEIEIGLQRLETYDINNPHEYGDSIIYVHKYTDSELNIIRNVLKQNLDELIMFFTFILPNSLRWYSLEKQHMFYVFHEMKKAKRNINTIIEYLVDFICKGFLDLTSQANQI